MSDGEKVGLYLISQILLAEKNCILIIDEPELHLHKALMARLWNKLEEYRNDCFFIYITHDLDFAVSKSFNKLI
jgi:predicted ATP-dependent endonuclease of OLD family